MSSEVQAPKRFMFTLKMITIALYAGQVLFLFAGLFLNKDNIIFHMQEFNSIAGMFMIVFAFGTTIAYFILTKKYAKKVFDAPNIDAKKVAYQTLHIIKFACFEGIALFSLIIFMTTSNIFFTIYAIASFIIQYNFWPTKEKVMKQMHLSEEEKALF